MSFVITGATGHLGRLTVAALIDRGVEPAQILGAGRDAQRLADLEAVGVRTVRIDMADPSTLAALFAPGDIFLMISGNEPGLRVGQHENLLEAAVAAGVARIVYTSAPHADTSALVLAPEHKATEELLQASGLAITVLRNNWYTENYLPVLEQARLTGTVVANAGDGRVASASRSDYAEAAAVALLDESLSGAVLELTGDAAWTYDDLAAAIGDLIGREVVYRPVDPAEHLRELIGAGVDEPTARFVVALDSNIADGLLAETSGDLSALLSRPTTPLATGLASAAPPP